MNFYYTSKKNIYIFLSLYSLLLFSASTDMGQQELVRELLNENIAFSYENLYDRVFQDQVQSQRNLVKTYLSTAYPITGLYFQPTTHNEVVSFLEQKTGSEQITETILFFTEKENLHLETVFSLVSIESGFRPSAVNRNSSSRDFGLFQLNSRTFRRFTEEELLQIETNVAFGTRYLRYAFNLMTDTNSALAVYNAGPSRPLRGIIPVSTQAYIKKINKYAKQLVYEFQVYMSKKYSLEDEL